MVSDSPQAGATVGWCAVLALGAESNETAAWNHGEEPWGVALALRMVPNRRYSSCVTCGEGYCALAFSVS